MKIGIMGTGSVGQTLYEKLEDLGHEVMMGTRNVEKTLEQTENDQFGRPSFSEWAKKLKQIRINTFSEAAAFGELIINATNGKNSVAALKLAGASNLNGKTLIDVANPLEPAKNMLPVLADTLCNNNSLGEEIQRTFPRVNVVKALNSMWCGLMVDPGKIGAGEHNVFICGNEERSKYAVISLLEEIGWKRTNIIDLGDITASRGTEMLLPIWLRIMASMDTEVFNFKIVK
jgi:predicted dinucleotide-binding enzyme